MKRWERLCLSAAAIILVGALEAILMSGVIETGSGGRYGEAAMIAALGVAIGLIAVVLVAGMWRNR